MINFKKNLSNRRFIILKSFFKLILRAILKNYNFPKAIWSKGYGFIVENNGGFLNVVAPTETALPLWYMKIKYLKSANSYWLRLGSHDKRGKDSQIKFFCDYIVPNLKKPAILITSDGDTNILEDVSPQLIQIILNSPYIIRWYSQNVSVNNKFNKLIPIPIGLDLHYDRGNGVADKSFSFYKSLDRNKQRRKKIFVDCFINQTSMQRKNLFINIKNNDKFEILTKPICQYELWEKYSSYEYVLSLQGNGFDCHRTWEALGLGCKIIVVGDKLNNLYNGIPVYSIHESELSNIDLSIIDEYCKQFEINCSKYVESGYMLNLMKEITELNNANKQA